MAPIATKIQQAIKKANIQKPDRNQYLAKETRNAIPETGYL